MSKKRRGISKTPTYRSWEAMLSRCNNPNNNRYPIYGNRGIAVCERWLKFENFLEDMGLKPEGLTLERTNNDSDYFKENCQWATYVEQARNQRVQKNNKLGIKGISFRPDGKYRVRIWSNNRSHHIGHFADLGQAIIARKQAEIKYWGQVYG